MSRLITPAQPQGEDGREAAVDVDAHHVAAAGEHDERNEGERDAEREDDLAEHEHAGGVHPDGQNHDRGDHRERAAQHDRTLRTAGLAGSRREHKIVFYTLTDAGRGLLDAHLELAEVTS